MAVDVRLERNEKTPWGFRLIGGADYDIPLTIAKVQPGSLAEGFGLQQGDAVVEVNGVATHSMTHDLAYDVITLAGDMLLLRVIRGPAPQVLVSEFQPIPMQDFVPLSQPYEVQSDRSRTASPFVIPTIPYRPFSTEPFPDIPPVEDPIILNPEYHDEFDGTDDEEYLPETKFKLPISKQYVPDGKKKRGRITINKIINSTSQQYNEVNDVKYLEEMTKEIDINKIEETASNVVNESIVNAVLLTEEIKKSIDSKVREISMSSHVSSEKVEIQNNKIEELTTLCESETTSISKETNNIERSHNEQKNITNDEYEKFEMSTGEIFNNEEINVSSKNKIVQSDAINLTEKVIHRNTQNESINVEQNEISRSECKDNIVKKGYEQQNNILKSDKVETQLNMSSTKQNVNETKIIETKESDAKFFSCQNNLLGEKSKAHSKNITMSNSLAEQRAYTLGLQTIPNIRGHIDSSYHYNLLLKTFFIHLTDVMVALSRFILAEPDSSATREKKVIENVATNETTTVDKNEEIGENYKTQNFKEIQAKEISEVQVKEELIANKKLSRSKLAQFSEKKTVELTEKMDAVISEFQEKAQIETSLPLEVTRAKRSRSRSRLEEEVSRESDPLDWLDKQSENNTIVSTTEKNSSTMCESTIVSKTMETSSLESRINEQNQTKSESNRVTTTGSDKIIYVATVESHVYTNPDIIMENEIDISEAYTITNEESNQINIEIASTMAACEKEISQESFLGTFSEIEKETVNETKDVYENECEKTTFKEESIEATAQITEEQENKSNNVNDSTYVEIEEHVNLEIVESNNVHNQVLASIEKTEESFQKLIESNKNDTSDPNESIDVQEQILENVENIEKSSQELTKLSEQMTSLDHVESIGVHEQIVESVEITKEASQELTQPSKHVTNKEINEVSAKEKKLSFTVEEYSIEKSSLSIDKHSSVQATETQESSFTEKLLSPHTETNESNRNLCLIIENNKTEQNLETQTSVENGENNNIYTPTPITVPLTPLTDEYVFRLEIPMPQSRSTTPAPHDIPLQKDDDDHEDPHIVKKKLIPHIQTTIESIVYDKPLDSPNSTNGDLALKHGFERETTNDIAEEEDLLEIERKSSLLASAIDDTIKSIEMYKEEVGIQKTLKENVSTEREQYKKVESKELLQKEVFVNTEESSFSKNTKFMSNDAIQNVLNSVESKAFIDSTKDTNKEQEYIYSNINTKTEGKFKEHGSAVTSSTTKNESVTSIENDLSKSKVNSNDTRAKILSENTNVSLSKKSLGVKSENNKCEEIRILNTEVSEIMENDAQASVQLDEKIVNEKELGVNKLQFDENTQTTTKEVVGTTQGIINGMESTGLIDKKIVSSGKPGMSDDKIAALISGESELLREAHVMGLKRVLASHMSRKDDDSSVDFKKMKPTIESLKDSEVLKVLNEELTKTKTEKKAEERKWTTFLQTPKRPVPRAKFGYSTNLGHDHEKVEETYKVKIIKQPKPKVAPDYKPQDFETGPLPWEERASKEPPPPPAQKEDPILVPEEVPQYLEAVDPLPESEVPDLEDTGIPLPPEKEPEPAEPEQEVTTEQIEVETPGVDLEEEGEELDLEKIVEETAQIVQEMEQNKLADEILLNIQSMVDPNAPLDQQLTQMRAQLAALAKLPGVIQQTLELVTRQLTTLSAHEESKHVLQENYQNYDNCENIEVKHFETDQEIYENRQTDCENVHKYEETNENVLANGIEAHISEEKVEVTLKEEAKEEIKSHLETAMLVEESIAEKQMKEQMEQMHLDQESRQLKQRPTPRVGKPKPAFGPLTPQERPMVLPGGRRWRTPKDAYNDEFIAETLTAQAEIIQGKAKGLPFESVLLPYDQRVNFLKYEKPPVSLDHLKTSEVYKEVHNMDETRPLRRVELLTPIIAESDYREKCRSVTPSREGQHMNIPQQFHP